MILTALLIATLTDGPNSFVSRPSPGKVQYLLPRVLQQGTEVHFQSEHFTLKGTVDRAVASQGKLIVTGTTPAGDAFAIQRSSDGIEGYFRALGHTVFVLQGSQGMALHALKPLGKNCGGALDSEGSIENLSLGGPCDLYNTIDVLVPYTLEAIQAVADSGAFPPIAWYDAEAYLRSLVRTAILQANVSYLNSEVPLQLNVRGLHLISEPEPETHGAPLLSALEQGLNGEGPFAELQDIREDLRADIVTLVSGNDYSFCGVASERRYFTNTCGLPWQQNPCP